MKISTKEAAKPMVRTIKKNLRMRPGQRKRLEKQAEKREKPPDGLVAEPVMEAPGRRERPRTEAKIHLLCSAMYAAQTIIRDMERDEGEDEIERIGRNISEIAPEFPRKSEGNMRSRAGFGQ